MYYHAISPINPQNPQSTILDQPNPWSTDVWNLYKNRLYVKAIDWQLFDHYVSFYNAKEHAMFCTREFARIIAQIEILPTLFKSLYFQDRYYVGSESSSLRG
jgi:hypothetical protein